MMPPQVDEVPAPPPGPGVVAPFAAPPRDRDLKGLWIGLGVGGLVLVLCCVGGVLGIGFVVPLVDDLGRSQVASVVEEYLSDLQNEDYEGAHALLCEPEQSRHPVGWFEDRYQSSPVIDFTVDPNKVRFAQEIVVPAEVTQKGRAPRTMEYTVEQDGTRYFICGGVE